MRTIPVGLNITGDTLSLAHCWKVTLNDGTVLGFTDHDQDIDFDGLTYLAATGYTASSIETSGALNVDNLEVQGMLESPSITENELRAGRWDYAAVEIFLCDWRAPSAGRLMLRYGRLGQVTEQGRRFHAELRGLMQQLQQSIGAIYQASCRADFGDAQCKFDAPSVTFTVPIEAVSSDGRTISSAALVQAADYFTQGKCEFVDGVNVGHIAEIHHSEVGSVTLQMPSPYAPTLGDSIAVTAGCQKRWDADCRDKFNNIVNFRGEPYLPGTNMMMRAGVR